jgi:hypothetical protein
MAAETAANLRKAKDQTEDQTEDPTEDQSGGPERKKVTTREGGTV